MKIKEDPPTAAPVTKSDKMDGNSFAQCSKPSELIDVCMDALRKEDEGSQGSSYHSTLGTQGKRSDRSLASTLGEFDVDVMQPFYPQCERDLGATAPRSMTVGDSSGDETFAAEILSPMSAPTFGIPDVTSPVRWSSHQGEACGAQPQRDSHTVEAVSVASGLRAKEYSEQARSNRLGRRFLSAETMRPVTYSRHKDKLEISESGFQVTEDCVIGEPQPSYRGNNQIDCAVKNNSASILHSSQKEVAEPLSSVMHEIDIAVSMAHSRFKDAGLESQNGSENASNRNLVDPNFSPRKFSTRSDLHVVTRQPNRRADACPPMTKDYAPHNMRARSTEDEWKRKSDYGGSAPAVHELSFEQSRSGDSLGPQPVGSYSAPRGERSCGAMEMAPCESAASSEQSRRPYETKINSNDDERNIASYSVGDSLLGVQSSSHEPHWPQMRTYEKQVLARSSGRSGAGGVHREELSSSEVDNKPINLCLQQGKRPDSVLGSDISALKSSKASEFRKSTRSFSARNKPYQIPKRRTRSQCSISPISTNSATRFDPGFVNVSPGSNRQTAIRDMGIDNRTVLENCIKEPNTFFGGKGNLLNSNSPNLFSASEASHMMVQDEAKTYAILSGRCNEDLMNPHALTASGSPHQQHSLYQQARLSHSIINYAGPHGHSPDMRTSEMSPSPPIRDHRATPASSLPGIMPSGKGFPNVIVAPRQHQHSESPSQRDDFHGHEMFQRQFETSSAPFDPGLQDTRRHLHQHHSLALGHHPNTSTFSPLHISPPQHHHHQQQSQYLVKHHQKKEYFDSFPSHSGLGTSGSMSPYAGTLQVAQHHGYLKPPPVDLDDLSDEERERMRVKRERNRVAAAKCRNRRRELLERLEKEAEQLEREQELLRENVRRLRVQKLQLGNMLEEHEPTCQKNIIDEGPSTSPTDHDSKDDAMNSVSTGVLVSDSGESSTKTTTSPVQLQTQA